MEDEIIITPCNNELERLGIMVKAHDFVSDFTECWDESFDDTYNTLSCERGGRFDCHEDYYIRNNGDFYAGAFIHSRGTSYAEIWSSEKDCIVAYVRL